MNLRRVLSLALAAGVVSAIASCAGDGRSPTGTDTNPSPGSEARTNGTQLVLAGGGGQTGAPGQPLQDPVVVRVLDASARPVSGATVNFIARDGSADPAQAKTDTAGYARTTWTLGTAAGGQELRVAGTGGTTLVVGATAVAQAKVARVKVIPDSLVLSQGATGDLSAVAYDSTGSTLTGRAITWTSSDSAIARVGSTGMVTAVSPGVAMVTATVEGVSGSAMVFVVAPPPAAVARVVVSPDSVVLQPGHTADLGASAYDPAGHPLTGRAVTWTTADSAVARVDAHGVVTAVSVGTARVTATVEGVSGFATVFVVAPPPAAVARVVVSPDSVVLQPGHTADFGASAYDAAGHPLTGRAVTWSLADSAVARVSAEGVVTAVSVGTATVVATVEGVRGTATVFVVAPPPAAVARVTVSPDSVVLQVGHTADFDAAAYDAGGHALTGRAVTWEVSDSAVARISAEGGVIALSAGSAQVIATVEGVSGTARLIVVPPPPAPVARVVVSPDSVVLQPGHTADLDAAAYDANGHALTGRAVAWSTSDSTVARVDAHGVVTPAAAGTARVTATVEGVSGSATVFVASPPAVAVARVAIVPDSLVLDVGGSGDFDAVAYDAGGHVVTGRAVTWSRTDSTIVTLGADGSVTGEYPGSTHVRATVEGVSATAGVRVREPAPPVIVRVEVSPDSLAIEIGQTGDFSAFAYDATNHVITGLPVTWSASDSTVVQLNLYGGVRALTVGTARLTATVQGVKGSATVRVFEHPAGSATAPPNVSPDISAGYDYVCRLRSGIVQCFGSSGMGQPIGEHRAAAGSFVQLSAGQAHACALRSDGVVECFGSNESGEAPAQKRAATGSFTQVSAGLAHTCAIRSDGAMECWGANGFGEAPRVVAAQSGKFVVVAAFANRTCALRNDGAVECRGYRHGDPDVTVLPGGWYVRLGTSVGTTICLERNSGLGECWGSQPNLGTGPFEELTAGASHECVLRPDGNSFCAGYPAFYQGPDERAITDRKWARLAAGSDHTCGLRPDGYFECFGLQTIGSDAPDVVPSADTARAVVDSASVRVTWRDINSNELRTEVDRSVADANGDATTWERAGVVGANVTGLTDTQAAPGRSYIYRTRVCNNAGCSGWAQSKPTH